jgi:hypothetical protein
MCWSAWRGSAYQPLSLIHAVHRAIMQIPEDGAFVFSSRILTVALCALVAMLAGSVIAWTHIVPLVYLP